MHVVIHFDGICLNNGSVNAVGGYGWHADEDSNRLASEYGRVDGQSVTNNVAEYRGLIECLQWLSIQPGVRTAMIHGDSQLVINQTFGTWRCNHPNLVELRDAARDLIREMSGVKIESKWIPREQNAEANRLSELAVREAD